MSTFALPVREYIDPEAMARQCKLIFEAGPEYLGHELMTPEIHDQIPLPVVEESCFLVHTSEGHKVFVNSCPHRSKKLVTQKTSSKQICCGGHCFVYQTTGKLIKAPLFNPCPKLSLHRVETSSYHGMLFKTSKAEDLTKMFNDIPPKTESVIKMDGYKYCGDSKYEHPAHWLVALEVFDDILHVPFIHPSLSIYANVKTIANKTFSNGSCQTVEVDQDLLFNEKIDLVKLLQKPEQKGLLKYFTAVRKIIQLRPELKDDPTLKHIEWISLYPGILVESYPFLKTITVIRPVTTTTSRQISEFYCKEGLPKELESLLIEGGMEFLNQTDDEDCLLVKEEQEGIEYLAQFNIQARGLTHAHLEAGVPHRHAWIGKKLGLC